MKVKVGHWYKISDYVLELLNYTPVYYYVVSQSNPEKYIIKYDDGSLNYTFNPTLYEDEDTLVTDSKIIKELKLKMLK